MIQKKRNHIPRNRQNIGEEPCGAGWRGEGRHAGGIHAGGMPCGAGWRQDWRIDGTERENLRAVTRSRKRTKERKELKDG